MTAVAELKSRLPLRAPENSQPSRRQLSSHPVCKICSDTMVAAEASAFLTDDSVSYLWSCDNCGYGFVTNHAIKPLVCS